MANRVSRAGHRLCNAERAARAANEGRLAGAELAGDGDDIARSKPRGEFRARGLGFFG
jgi:hypothetical protein